MTDNKRKELDRAREISRHSKKKNISRTPEDVSRELWSMKEISSTSLKEAYEVIRKGVL